MKRNQLLLLLCIFSFIACEENTNENQKHAPPNILFFFADDLRADAIGAYDNPNIKTPTLDRLIQNGYSFRNNYCMGSHHGAVCAPSRAMLLTGKTLFHVYNDLDTVKILPEYLQEAGYTTFGTGKWHNKPTTFRGFDYGKNIYWGGMSDHNKVPAVDQLPDGSFTEKEERGFSSEIFVNSFIDFLDTLEQKEEQKPFYAYLSFTAPHDPRTPPGEYLEMYKPGDVPLPANYMPQHPFHNGWMTGRDEVLAPWPRTEEVIQHQLAEYYGLISHLDAQIGRAIKALEEKGLAENTVIIFAADHGLAVGSHGLLGKQSLYEHSMKAPLVFSGKGIPKNQETKSFTYLYDIFPTILQLAETPCPSTAEGESLSQIWSGEKAKIRETLFTTYEDIHKAVRDDRWKFIHYPKIKYSQLFDLENDPHELNNLAFEKEYLGKAHEMMTLLNNWQNKMDDPHPRRVEKEESMIFDPSQIERKVDRWQPQWVVEKYFEKEWK